MTVDFNTNIINELVYQNGNEIEIDKHFPKINKWKTQQEKPTYNELVKLAKFFNIPFGYFFLNTLPQKVYPVPHYRTMATGTFKPSAELQTTIETVKARQDWAKDVISDTVGHPLTFANSINLNTTVEDAAAKIRSLLKTATHWSNEAPTWGDAFKLLLTKTEEAGIFVVLNGIVNNSTRKKLNINEFRGFVLYDSFAPFIFINNNDYITGKIFTIIHEIVHILLGQSASFDYAYLLPASNQIEQYCNKVAAEFLVPSAMLLDKTKTTQDQELLARYFKVSRFVIARRLYDLKIISSTQLQDAYSAMKLNIKEKALQDDNKKPGGDFYNTAPYRISKEFFNLVYLNVQQNKLLYRDAFMLTGLSAKSFDGYTKKYFS